VHERQTSGSHFQATGDARACHRAFSPAGSGPNASTRLSASVRAWRVRANRVIHARLIGLLTLFRKALMALSIGPRPYAGRIAQRAMVTPNDNRSALSATRCVTAVEPAAGLGTAGRLK
jgi:hypothetical protein